MHFLLVALTLLLTTTTSAFAQASESEARAGSAPKAPPAVVIDGPEPSPQPNVMTRDPKTFKSTIRAIKRKLPAAKVDPVTAIRQD